MTWINVLQKLKKNGEIMSKKPNNESTMNNQLNRQQNKRSLIDSLFFSTTAKPMKFGTFLIFGTRDITS